MTAGGKRRKLPIDRDRLRRLAAEQGVRIVIERHHPHRAYCAVRLDGAENPLGPPTWFSLRSVYMALLSPHSPLYQRLAEED
jgi:hypothetical protein